VRGLVAFLVALALLAGVGVATAVTRGYSPSQDELKPNVATFTEQGTVKIVTTGP
jgi:hypothetical protein